MIGTIQVSKPSGMDVLNNSINTLVNDIPRDEWKMVSVAVAPSTITISFVDGGEPPLDCRVRFLSFLGIGQESAQYCAFIVHTAQVANRVRHLFLATGNFRLCHDNFTDIHFFKLKAKQCPGPGGGLFWPISITQRSP